MNFPDHIGLSPKVIALMLCFLDYSRLQKILEEILEMHKCYSCEQLKRLYVHFQYLRKHPRDALGNINRFNKD